MTHSRLGDSRGGTAASEGGAVARFQRDLGDAKATDEQVNAATEALRAALAEVTSEEYPTPDEYVEAVVAVASQVAARLVDQPIC